ncbi:MAG: hypothetical protein LC104_02285 [Bacteroidales bacterium]|nr:hypothetical protein [Bacteroidales bacterium]
MQRNLLRIIKGTQDHVGYIDSSHGSVYLRQNEDFSASRSKEDGGFVFYKYAIEVSLPAEGCEKGDFVSFVKELIHELILLPADVVAACDFEDDLTEGRWIRRGHSGKYDG